MKGWIVFIGIIALQFMAGCHDDPQPPDPSVNEAEMVRQLKEYTYFKEGSYWVYEDSATGDLDSMFVYYADDGEGVDGNGERYYWFNCFIYSTRDSFEYHYTYHSSWSTSNPYRTKVFRAKTKPGDDVGETAFVDFPFVSGRYFYWSSNDSILTENLLGSFQMGIDNYLSVAVVHHTNDVSELSQTRYWIAKHFGIVKYKVNDSNRVWQLLRKVIIQ